MKQNIDKLLDRDVALTNLVTRADDLQTSATTYNQTTKQLRRKYWWKNAKVKRKKKNFSPYFYSSFQTNVCIGGIIFAVVLIIICKYLKSIDEFILI